MQSKYVTVLVTGSVGAIGGIVFMASLQGSLPQFLLGMGASLVPIAWAVNTVADSRYTPKLQTLQSEFARLKTSLKSAEARADELSSQYHAIYTQFKCLSAESERDKADLRRLAGVVGELSKAQVKIEELERIKDQYEIDWQEMEEGKEAAIEQEVKKRLRKLQKEEIQRIWAEADKHCQNFSSALDEATELMLIFKERADNAKIVAHSIGRSARKYSEKVDKQIEDLIGQIEIKNAQIALLQQELAGDLVEPQYGQFGYAIEGRIANDIARRIWEGLQIPLAVKGYQIKSDGSTDVGYGYSRSIPVEALLGDLNRNSGAIAKVLGIHKITSVRKLEIADLIVLTFRREPSVKEDTVKLLAGTPEEFIAYVTSHPIRYRLIADPGQGKTPTTAVMVSEILRVGGTRGNTGKGKKIPHTLVTVSCPDVESSQKDADYPLELFLKYGNTTSALKSIDDALEDWQYRKRDTVYAENFFQLWVWDELDNTLSSASDPKGTGESFKKILKQCHHTGVGWIVSGQSVMTSQIPGFMDDDRELFTQIIIGTSKIRKYLEKYGKKVLSAKVVTQLLKNLDDLEPYIEDKNSMITDGARLLRLALVLDDKSPKLYFLPNLDSVKFDAEKVECVITKADQMKRQFLARASGKNGSVLVSEAENAYTEGTGKMVVDPPFSTIGGSNHSSQSSQIPHCPHCGGSDLKVIDNGTRYRCQGCTKRFVNSKAIWK